MVIGAAVSSAAGSASGCLTGWLPPTFASSALSRSFWLAIKDARVRISACKLSSEAGLAGVAGAGGGLLLRPHARTSKEAEVRPKAMYFGVR